MILAFVGVKMIIHNWLEISGSVSLLVIGLVLVVSVAASLRFGGQGEVDDDIDLIEVQEPPPSDGP